MIHFDPASLYCDAHDRAILIQDRVSVQADDGTIAISGTCPVCCVAVYRLIQPMIASPSEFTPRIGLVTAGALSNPPPRFLSQSTPITTPRAPVKKGGVVGAGNDAGPTTDAAYESMWNAWAEGESEAYRRSQVAISR